MENLFISVPTGNKTLQWGFGVFYFQYVLKLLQYILK